MSDHIEFAPGLVCGVLLLLQYALLFVDWDGDEGDDDDEGVRP